MKKYDILLIVALLCIGGLIVFTQALNRKSGNQVEITVDGEVYKVLDLNEDREVKVPCDEGHYNIVVIKDGKADMTESDCKNQVCVKSAAISQVGETIVCLPHKVIVKVIAKK